jgi:hypothetical protein
MDGRLSEAARAAITRFAYNMCNGTLGYPLLENHEEYAASWGEEPSAAEQAMAIYLNVLALDQDGRPLDSNEAEIRAAQYVRRCYDTDYDVEPPFEAWELERHPYGGGGLGPMP